MFKLQCGDQCRLFNYVDNSVRVVLFTLQEEQEELVFECLFNGLNRILVQNQDTLRRRCWFSKIFNMKDLSIYLYLSLFNEIIDFFLGNLALFHFVHS